MKKPDERITEAISLIEETENLFKRGRRFKSTLVLTSNKSLEKHTLAYLAEAKGLLLHALADWISEDESSPT